MNKKVWITVSLVTALLEITAARKHSSVNSSTDCHPWMFYNETSRVCECSDIPYRAVLCDPTIPRTSILDCYCMTFNSQQNAVELGRCLYGCGHKVDNVYYELPPNKSSLNMYTCEMSHRDSSLCGECKAGYSPLVYSYDLKCMNCTGMTYNWIKYIAVAYIPLTLFFGLVIIFRLNGASPLLRGFISISQGIVSPFSLRAYLLGAAVESNSNFNVFVKLIGTIYGVWNLDFFRTVLPPICLNITPIQALSLDYAIAFYPLLLVVVTYILISLHSNDIHIVVWLWKPFHRVFHSIKQDWSDIDRSVVKSFATFFTLSYLKFLNVTVDLLVYTEKYTLPVGEQNYRVKHVLYYDATVEYFSTDHLYYGITAMFIGLFIVLLPLVFLVIYPMRWFQRCLNCCKIQRQSIDTFVNCYQGYYKDGTNGTRDCRCFSITFFLFEVLLVSVFVSSKSMFVFPVAALILMIGMFVMFVVQPYKEQFKQYILVDAFMILTLAINFATFVAADEANVKASYFSEVTHYVLAFLSLIPFGYLVVLSIWWMFVKKKLYYLLPCIRMKLPLR